MIVCGGVSSEKSFKVRTLEFRVDFYRRCVSTLLLGNVSTNKRHIILEIHYPDVYAWIGLWGDCSYQNHWPVQMF